VSFRKNDDSPFNNPPSHRRYDVVESRTYPGKPTSAAVRNDTWRLDVVKVGPDGRLEKFYDMKFKNDKPDKNWFDRKKAYKAIAAHHGGRYETFVVEKKCHCPKQDEAQPQTQPQHEPEENLLDKFKEMLRPAEKPLDFPLDPGAPKPPPPRSPALPPLPGMPPIRL
jgi:hypothetical protein